MSDNVLAEMERDFASDPGNYSLERAISTMKSRQGIKGRIVLVWVADKSRWVFSGRPHYTISSIRPLREGSYRDLRCFPVRDWSDPKHSTYRPLIHQEVELLRRQKGARSE